MEVRETIEDIEAALPVYGLMAEFTDPEDLLEATRRTVESGYQRIDAYSPFPVEGLAETLRLRNTRLPLIILGGGILGAVTGFAMQYYAMVIDYPINVGGRPLNSWPNFIPVAFELTILFAAFAAILGMLALNGLPMPYHPVFNVPNFELASRNHFFLLIEATDPKYDLEETRRFLEGLGPVAVSEVMS
jgi:ActD protein